jgi:hypothetical protein
MVRHDWLATTAAMGSAMLISVPPAVGAEATDSAAPVVCDIGSRRELVGDSIAQPVTWEKGGEVASLAGRAVRLRLVLRDADVFALWFRP